MENFTNQFNGFTDKALIDLFFKAFAVLFSVMYLVYSIFVTKQTQNMNRTLSSPVNRTLVTVSAMQIVFAIILIILSITVI